MLSMARCFGLRVLSVRKHFTPNKKREEVETEREKEEWQRKRHRGMSLRKLSRAGHGRRVGVCAGIAYLVRLATAKLIRSFLFSVEGGGRIQFAQCHVPRAEYTTTADPADTT